MTKSATKAPVRNGLRDISMDEFWKNPLIIVDAMHEKLEALPINRARHSRFAREIDTTLELFRALGTRRYGKISCLAAFDLFEAANYFLLLGDRTPDSQSDGYKDDADILHQAFAKHDAELKEFEGWLQTQS